MRLKHNHQSSLFTTVNSTQIGKELEQIARLSSGLFSQGRY